MLINLLGSLSRQVCGFLPDSFSPEKIIPKGIIPKGIVPTGIGGLTKKAEESMSQLNTTLLIVQIFIGFVAVLLIGWVGFKLYKYFKNKNK